VLVHELDGVLQGDDVGGYVAVDVVDDGGEGRGLAGPGGARHQEEPLLLEGQLLDDLGKAELFRRRAQGGNETESGDGQALLGEGVGAEARQARDGEGEV